MAVEQPSRADRGSAATEYVPAPLAIQKRLLVCQKGKGGGGRRAASGPRCAAARPCWLADREDEGRATYREGPSQTAPLLAAVGWAPVRASPRRAALRCASCLACLYLLLAELAIPEPEPGSASTDAAAMRVHPTSGSRWRNPAPGSQTADGEWQVVIRDCKPGKPCSCCLALPCLHAWLSPGGRLLPFSFGVCRARQGKTRQGFGSTGAHHWPKATGCRISRGWLPAHRGLWIGEAPGGVGRCRDDWKSLKELGGQLPSPRPSRSGNWVRGLPACAATAAGVGS